MTKLPDATRASLERLLADGEEVNCSKGSTSSPIVYSIQKVDGRYGVKDPNGLFLGWFATLDAAYVAGFSQAPGGSA
jgi:hypothetical protein